MCIFIAKIIRACPLLKQQNCYTLCMFIYVRLFKGYKEPLIYSVPASWNGVNYVGSVVSVPFRTHVVKGIVVAQYERNPEKRSFTIKEASTLEVMPDDAYYTPFIQQLAGYYQVESVHFVKRVQQFLKQKELAQDGVSHTAGDAPSKTVVLTDEQREVCDYLIPYVRNAGYAPTVMHGVTGSGKTEVYKVLIQENYAVGKTTVLLLPEVTLALQFQNLLKKQLVQSIPLYGFHSATAMKEKRQLWASLVRKEPVVIIGVHLPLLLPIPNLGLIIVDEEHEIGYQEKRHPKINAKEAALMRAALHKIPIVLGSATPSITTLYNVQERGWKLFVLRKRFSGAFPRIEKAFLTERDQRRNFWVSKKLERALQKILAQKEQAIIFLNRRGFSFFVQCKACSFVFGCTNCSVSLTLHEGDILSCHYCGKDERLAERCPSCADNTQFLKKGIGTQQLVAILKKLFPQARIERADLDTTVKKESWQETVVAFERGDIDILVGTQSITKGFHFPKVTLVGIIWADLSMNMPFFNASEATLQQLIQVAGRAGRQRNDSVVIVQAMADHDLLQYVQEKEYAHFFEYELLNRKELGYPPYKRLVEIELKHHQEAVVDREAHLFVQALYRYKGADDAYTILGPAKPPVFRIKNIETRKIYIKHSSIKKIIDLYLLVIGKNKFTSSVFFTPSPQS